MRIYCTILKFFLLIFNLGVIVSCSNLSTITISQAPNTTTFATGSYFDIDGINILATYDDETSSNITNKVVYSINGKNYTTLDKLPDEAGDYTVTVSYTKRKITKTTDFTIKLAPAIEFDSIKNQIWYLTKDSTICVNGFITSEDLKKIAELIKGSEYKIALDLSETVGLKNLATGSYTRYGEGVFAKNPNLIEIVLPDSIESITEYAFQECKNLKKVIIPNGVTKIKEYAFAYCDSLECIVFPDSLIEIGHNAFHSCKKIKEVMIPTNVKSIEGNVFGDCENLRRIAVSKNNPVYDNRNACNAIVETATNTLITGCFSTTIPTTVTKIGDSAFWGCKNLRIIEIPDNVTHIGDSAFLFCENIRSIVIPTTVKTIGKNPLGSCSNLTSITVSAGNTEYDSRNSCNAIIKTSTDTLIAGCYKTKIPYGVKTIGESSFDNCEQLEEIKIPDSVLYIEKNAFNYCPNLKNVTIPNSVILIGANAFWLCSKLRTMIIPRSVNTIEPKAFDACHNLRSVSFQESDGWYATKENFARTGINLDLTDSSTTAEYLRSTYSSYYWYRK